MAHLITAERIVLNETCWLELIAERHAAPLLAVVNKNRQRLRQWLPWVDAMQTHADFLRYVAACQTQHTQGTDLGYVIFVAGHVAGRIGIHQVSTQNKTAMIGYWIGTEHSGRGLVTMACAHLLNVCFEQLPLNRIEIRCATGNEKSAAIPRRLGFQKEGILREAEWVNGAPHDHALYALLRSDWKKVKSAAEKITNQ